MANIEAGAESKGGTVLRLPLPKVGWARGTTDLPKLPAGFNSRRFSIEDAIEIKRLRILEHMAYHLEWTGISLRDVVNIEPTARDRQRRQFVTWAAGDGAMVIDSVGFRLQNGREVPVEGLTIIDDKNKFDFSEEQLCVLGHVALSKPPVRTTTAPEPWERHALRADMLIVPSPVPMQVIAAAGA